MVEAFPLQHAVDCLGQPGKRVLVRSDDGLTERLLAVVLELLLQCSLPIAEFGPHGDGYNLLPLVDDEHPVVLTVLEQSHLKAVTNLPLVRLAEVYQLYDLVNLLLGRFDQALERRLSWLDWRVQLSSLFWFHDLFVTVADKICVFCRFYLSFTLKLRVLLLIVQIKQIFLVFRANIQVIFLLKGKLVLLNRIHRQLCFGPLIELNRLAFDKFLSLPSDHSYARNHLLPFNLKKLLMWVVGGLLEYVITVGNLHDGRWLNFYEQLFVIARF